MPLPCAEERYLILRVHSARMPLDRDVDLRHVADSTNGMSGADLEGVCREAALNALRDSVQASVVSARHFLAALPSSGIPVE